LVNKRSCMLDKKFHNTYKMRSSHFQAFYKLFKI
jgi:hypothetical protein